MQMTDRELEEIVKSGRHIEVLVNNELDYRGAIVSYNRKAFQVSSGDWYLREIETVTTKYA